MAKTAEKTDPALWEMVKNDVTRGGKGGRPGQWSARKAQLAVKAYKDAGGGYKGAKSADNHLVQWTREDWGTRSGGDSMDTGERYLPKAARAGLTKEDYDRSTAKKRADTRQGRQFSAQPGDIARKTAAHRSTERSNEAAKRAMTRMALMGKARERNLPGRSRMNRAQLAQALAETS